MADALTPGSINPAADTDDWAFFGRAGRAATVIVNPGAAVSPAALPSYLGFASVQVFDPSANPIAAGTSSFNGDVVTLAGVFLPVDGAYRTRIEAPAAQPNLTGNYIVTVRHATPGVFPLVLNRQVRGEIGSSYRSDQWIFTAAAGQQVQFDLINVSGSGILFDMKPV